MLTLQLHDELATQLFALVQREHTTPELLIQKLINQYSAITEKENFFQCRIMERPRYYARAIARTSLA